MYATRLSGPQVAKIEMPWASKVPPAKSSPERLAGILHQKLNLFRAAHDRGNVFLAVETMAEISEALTAARKAGIDAGDLEDVARAYGIELDIPDYRDTAAGYIQALVRQEIGDWNPNEVGYPKYRALRNFYRGRKPTAPSVQTVVEMPGMTNGEKRLRPGQAWEWDRVPENRRRQSRIQQAPTPAPRRELAPHGYKTQAAFFASRKTLAKEPMPRLQRGYILHADPGRAG